MNKKIEEFALESVGAGIEKAAIGYLDAYIEKAIAGVEKYEAENGVTIPREGMLDEAYQEKVRQLIRGEGVENPDVIALTIAGDQIDKAIEAYMATRTPRLIGVEETN